VDWKGQRTNHGAKPMRAMFVCPPFTLCLHAWCALRPLPMAQGSSSVRGSLRGGCTSALLLASAGDLPSGLPGERLPGERGEPGKGDSGEEPRRMPGERLPGEGERPVVAVPVPGGGGAGGSEVLRFLEKRPTSPGAVVASSPGLSLREHLPLAAASACKGGGGEREKREREGYLWSLD
jgi:hypothetical protein